MAIPNFANVGHTFDRYIHSKYPEQYLENYIPEFQVIFRGLLNMTDTLSKSCKTKPEISRLDQLISEMYGVGIDKEIESMVVCYQKLANLQARIWDREIKASILNKTQTRIF